ncbi:hypothetical protein CR66_01625 [Campylobacter mucosalis]|nr:hypothetical protein [Campylobacter mucosalis]KEA46562.1 hypothetical protein CR66_01625 [Campylobacter mucosalis]QKF62932.1 hypothetical protein CMCT_0793 [Campylobacter mucosalis]
MSKFIKKTMIYLLGGFSAALISISSYYFFKWAISSDEISTFAWLLSVGVFNAKFPPSWWEAFF